MSYEMYTTEALVCGRILRGEHDLTLRLYTKDAGMIFARAGGVRAHESKLRYGLQDFSYATVSLVRGRHEWRVTGATIVENLYYATPSREHRAALRSALRFIRRFLMGTSAEPELFALILEGVQTLAKDTCGSEAEDLFLLRMLHRLGYVSPRPLYADLMHGESLKDAHTEYLLRTESRPAVKAALQNALTVSHL